MKTNSENISNLDDLLDVLYEEQEGWTVPDVECKYHRGQMAQPVAPALALKPHWTFACDLCRAELKERAVNVTRKWAGIPSSVWSATLENFQTDRPNVDPKGHSPAIFVSSARALMEGKIKNLVLTGGVGIGKGHIAAAVANYHLANGNKVEWRMASELFTAYHDAYKDRNHVKVLARLQAAGIFILDEAAMRPLPSDGEEILAGVLFSRYEAGLPSIIISNQEPGVLNAWLGPRISDRMREGGCLALWGKWASFRSNK